MNPDQIKSEMRDEFRAEVKETNDSVRALAGKLSDLVGRIDVLISEHGNTKEREQESRAKLEDHERRIRNLEEFKASIEPLVKSLRNIGNKVILQTIVSLTGTAGIIAAIVTAMGK